MVGLEGRVGRGESWEALNYTINKHFITYSHDHQGPQTKRRQRKTIKEDQEGDQASSSRRKGEEEEEDHLDGREGGGRAGEGMLMREERDETEMTWTVSGSSAGREGGGLTGRTNLGPVDLSEAGLTTPPLVVQCTTGKAPFSSCV
mmetsp:Transcript_1294/g.2259  ORF Transcript_1294/g.2259 Transcript_1294/m.2259 type:complete len:146 (+) Transcript_1294:79-516(+)